VPRSWFDRLRRSRHSRPASPPNTRRPRLLLEVLETVCPRFLAPSPASSTGSTPQASSPRPSRSNDLSFQGGGRGTTKVMSSPVTLSAPSEKWIYVNFATRTAPHDAATLPGTSVTLAFAPASDGDHLRRGVETERESDERSSSPRVAVDSVITDGQVLGTILDDDTPPRQRQEEVKWTEALA